MFSCTAVTFNWSQRESDAVPLYNALRALRLIGALRLRLAHILILFDHSAAESL